MKPLQLPPLCAASALADAFHSHDVRMGVCGLRVFPSFFSTVDPVCRPDLSRAAYLSSGDSIAYGQDISWHTCQANGTTNSHHNHYPWTHSSPCFKSKEDSQQFCVFSDSVFAGDRGTALVTTAKRAAHLARNLAFTDPSSTKGTNQDLVRTKPAKYKVAPIEGKGMGVVATGFIIRGELIMANTASLMIDYAAFEDLEREEYLELQAKAIEVLPEKHRDRILNLSTHDQADNFTYLEFIEKITSTNAFDIDADSEDEDQEHGFYVVFPEIARTNHDCRPSADYYFDHETLTQYIHAIRPIFPGEEISISYINPLQSQRRRARKLSKTWGFHCGCASCAAEKATISASDERIRQILDLAPEFKNYKAGSRATPQMAELLISLYEQEKLGGMLYEAYTYAAIEWNGIGEPWTAIKYARLAIEYGVYSVGDKDNDVVEMENLANDPWNHWSWMLRSGKRMGWGVKGSDEDEEEE